ncbi:MAG: hypothetical protein QGG36_07760 [Pirellulaceae bacterium]|jgi:hypothetical protein|nr:hypothetical protein [Pirellulaceae bacterium]
MAKSTAPLLPASFLFRFSAPLRYSAAAWTKKGIKLGDEYQLPCFGELNGDRVFALLYGAWNEEGLSFVMRVSGKSQEAWCRPNRAEDSDGLQLWIDTRDTHTVHRARRFCHRFCIAPFGGGRALDKPSALMLPINRAVDFPKPLPDGAISTYSEKRIDGYVLHARIPAATLTGWDTAEHPRIGFYYAVVDRELGLQTFSVGAGFPYSEDPSLWGTLELTPQ